MSDFLKKIRQTKKPSQFLFLVMLIGITLANLPILGEEIKRLNNYKKVLHHNVIGYQFKGLHEFIPDDVKYIGYFTDADFKEDKPVKLFSQAQFMLVPAVLDPYNLNHNYILLVCKNPVIAFRKIQELGLEPLQMNVKHGIILARKPQ